MPEKDGGRRDKLRVPREALPARCPCSCSPPLLSAAFGPLGLLTLLASVLPGAPRVSTSGLRDEVGDRMDLRTERKPSFAVRSPV